uniref:KIND domain-containing protein n=1 Tax=Lepeophtheirus salmonis TaxID=72036 RepID=A0A0K2URD6_LEPSM
MYILLSDSEDTEIEEDHRTIETDDEGIEQDHDDLSSTQQQSNHKLSHNLSFLYRVLNLCTNHLSVSKEADLHFKNVCRALVTEALELSFFIERVQNRDLNQAKEIQELALLDWACLWKETMFQLRQGVKLKKTDYTKTPIEYGLTPYEILMDDIRSRRYKLNKVLVNGDLPPKVKKDAHDIILDFIRSRPPLKPASRRVLPPKKLNVTPQELLMKSICSPSAKASLKKTPGPPSPKKSFIEGYPKSIIPSIYTSDELDSSYPLKEKKPTSPKKLSNSSSLLSLTRKQRSSILCEKSRSSGNLKRLIRPDPHFLKFDPYDEDDDFFSSPLSPELKRSPSNSPTANKHNVFSSGMGRSHIQRRSEASLNKFVTNLSPILPEARRVSYTSPSDADSVKLRQLNLAMTSTPNILGSQGDSFISPQCSPKLNSKISRRDDWSIFNKCDLSLEEMIHIRSVHTKAELEDSVVEPRIKTDLESSKLCFLCMKNYFGFFSWSYKCKLCKKCVCSSCMTKIRIPSDDFSKISVKSIHDSLEREDSPNSNEQPRLKVRAFNSSVDLQDRLSSIPKNNKINSEPSSLPLTPTSTHDKKVKLRRSNTLKHERESFKKGDGTSMISVCLKCKEIIQHIPKSQRRQQVTRSLCLG